MWKKRENIGKKIKKKIRNILEKNGDFLEKIKREIWVLKSEICML